MTFRWLPEGLSKEKREKGLCGISGCKGIGIVEIAVENNDKTHMWIFLCHTHLKSAWKCSECVFYEEETLFCKALPPQRFSEKVRGPARVQSLPEEWCGAWRPRRPIKLEKFEEEKNENREEGRKHCS